MIDACKNWLEENYENMLADLSALIACKSVEAPAKDGMPFGEECYKALCCVGDICTKLGFTFHNENGYVGYMDYEETGSLPPVGVLVHVDVVPPCNFTDDPYTLIRKDGKLIARGVLDDKGPCIIMIYVLAALKKAGFRPSQNVRLLFGCNEETGWRGVTYAKEKGLIPPIGYSPDADYPLINREKGIISLEIKGESNSNGKIQSITAGKAVNAVPDICKTVLNMSAEEVAALFSGTGADIEPMGTGCTVTVYGKASHASIPSQGDNALIKTLTALQGLDGLLNKLCAAFTDTNGKGLGLNNGDISCVLSKIYYKEENFSCFVDIRYPFDIEFNKIDTHIKDTLNSFSLKYINHNPAHSVDESHRLCVSLLKAYEIETGEKGEAKSIGGGTYSRVFETGVAFGCTFEGEPMCAHMADEFMTETSFKKNLSIQLQGVYQLCK